MTKSWSYMLVFGIDASRLQVSCVSAESEMRIWYPENRAYWYILTIEDNKMHYFSTLFW